MAHNVLLIQDESSVATTVREALLNSSDGSFRVEWIRSCAEGLQRLARQATPNTATADNIAVVLVDLFLPDSQGVETFDRIFNAVPQIPILVLAASQDEEVAKLAVRLGAQDYLLKDRLDAYLLPKTVRSMIERAVNAEALFEEKERVQVTLDSIADAVVSVDVLDRVTYLNHVAEGLTGWSREQAAGHPVGEVLRIIDGTTRESVRNPMALAIQQDKAVGLTPNCVLIRRDGVEAAIDDSAAPIHDRWGRVTGAVMVFRDVGATRALSIKMSHLAQHDSLTDLPNRMLLNDRLNEAINLASRYRRKLALMFVDLDHFKDINDRLGHAIGDYLLQSVARRLLSCVRASDTVSRQGGDEFVILLPEVAHEEDVAVSADKILLAMRTPYRIDEHDLRVSASIGIATYPNDGTEAETLVKNADAAMYEAKALGRDKYQNFKVGMPSHAARRQAVEREQVYATK